MLLLTLNVKRNNLSGGNAMATDCAEKPLRCLAQRKQWGSGHSLVKDNKGCAENACQCHAGSDCLASLDVGV
jgi:hypothetical protein